MQIRPLLTLAALLASVAPANAQKLDPFTTAVTKPPTACVTCPPGKDGKPGKDGRDGKDGKDGRDGVDGSNFVCPARAWRPFDLGTHAIPLPVMSVITDRFCQRRIIAYSPNVPGIGPVAVRVNPDTGIGEVAYGFTAGLPGGITFDGVQALDGWAHLLWSHRGGHWLHVWPLNLPEVDLRTVITPHPRTGAPEALFRWRE